MGFRRPACSPLTVVASELALGATAYDGGGGAGARSWLRLVERVVKELGALVALEVQSRRARGADREEREEARHVSHPRRK